MEEDGDIEEILAIGKDFTYINDDFEVDYKTDLSPNTAYDAVTLVTLH